MKRWRLIEDRDVRHVVELWKRCGLTRPWNDPVSDIAFARRSATSDVLIWEEDGSIIASVMVGHDGHRGVMYYLGVDPAHQKKGIGREVVRGAEEWLADHGVWKVNLLLRNDNSDARGFYEKLGYAKSPVISLQKSIKR
jgi:ribosomal protein S18 acetylase RimI-like enzyme